MAMFIKFKKKTSLMDTLSIYSFLKYLKLFSNCSQFHLETNRRMNRTGWSSSGSRSSGCWHPPVGFEFPSRSVEKFLSNGGGERYADSRFIFDSTARGTHYPPGVFQLIRRHYAAGLYSPAGQKWVVGWRATIHPLPESELCRVNREIIIVLRIVNLN